MLHELDRTPLAKFFSRSLLSPLALPFPLRMAFLTMASPNIQAIWASKSPFIPQKPKIVSIGRTSVSLYRKVDENMSDPEKALAFHRTALAGADLDQRARI